MTLSRYPSHMTIRLDEHALGLDHPDLVRIHRLINDYDPNLSLRVIPPGDPIREWASQQSPPRDYGVWENNVDTSGFGGGLSNWVFTIARAQIDERTFARVLEADFRRRGVPERMAKLKAFDAAQDLSRKRGLMEKFEERREEMIGLGALARNKSTLRHTIRGEDVIIGDTVRPVRTHV